MAEPTNKTLDLLATLLANAVTSEEIFERAKYLKETSDRRTQWITEDDIELRDHIEEMLAIAWSIEQTEN